MPRTKKVEVEEIDEPVVVSEPVVVAPTPAETEKEKLLKVYQILLDYKVHSISDLENIIARM